MAKKKPTNPNVLAAAIEPTELRFKNPSAPKLVKVPKTPKSTQTKLPKLPTLKSTKLPPLK